VTDTTDPRAALVRRLYALPEPQRSLALRQLARIRDAQAKAGASDVRGARSQATRDPKQRRRYAGDPWAYFRDVLGTVLVPDQEHALELLHTRARVLLPSANAVGKTHLLAGWGLFRFDALAALEDVENGLPEQGARVLLPGPDHATVFATLYQRMLVHAARAEARGHLMPGVRSELSVSWRVRPEWEMEAFSPPARTGQHVAHTASGRHHRNQAALIEEGQGVPEPVWRAAEGMCSTEGNQIASSFNPTEPVGPAYQRARQGVYVVFHMSALRHPNIIERRLVTPDAIGIAATDARVRADCRDRGPWPATPVEPEHHDFVYALPPVTPTGPAPATMGARPDGVLGDLHGVPRVYRPNGAFTAQVLGQWPADSETGLFSAAAVDAAMLRGMARGEMAGMPDRVGVDPAREGGDDAAAAPAWGDAADALLRAHADAETRGPAALALLAATRRAVVGPIRVAPKGDGVDLARWIVRTYPGVPYTLDASGDASASDHLARVLGADVLPVSFGASPQPPIRGEPYSVDTRTQMYVRAAMLVARGLVDLPDDALLREELLAHVTLPTTVTAVVCEVTHPDGRVEEVWGELTTGVTPGANVRRMKKRVPAVVLLAKDDVKRLIGRSPDRADAFVLALHAAPRRPARRVNVAASFSYTTLR